LNEQIAGSVERKREPVDEIKLRESFSGYLNPSLRDEAGKRPL